MPPRIKNDAYYTPLAVAQACVRVLHPHLRYGTSVLEAHVGGGAFFEALFFERPDVVLSAMDIDPEAPGLEWALHRKCPAIDADFLQTQPEVDWIVGNPPYDNAQAHVEHALQHARQGVAFLLRLAFLESGKRAPFWHYNPPTSVHVLVTRPSFAFSHTDSAAYGWFVWSKGNFAKPTLGWIDWRTP